MTKDEIYDMEPSDRILFILDNQNKNATVRSMFKNACTKIKYISQNSNKHISSSVYDIISTIMSQSNYDEFIVSFILILIFNSNVRILDIKHPGYYNDIKQTLVNHFKNLKNAIIHDIIHSSRFSDTTFEMMKQGFLSEIDVQIKPEYFKKRLQQYPFRYINILNDLLYKQKNQDILPKCFENMYYHVSPNTFFILFPAIITLWINLINSSRRDVYLSNDFFNLYTKIESNDKGKKPEKTWPRRDLFLMSLLIPDGMINKNHVSWESKIESIIFNKVSAYKKVQIKHDLKNGIVRWYSPKEALLHKKYKSYGSVPRIYKYGSKGFWDLIHHTYNYDESIIDSLNGYANIEFFINLFDEKALSNLFSFSPSSKNFKIYPNKSFCMSYINYFTKWVDLLLVSTGMPYEANLINGIATKSVIRNIFVNNDMPFPLKKNYIKSFKLLSLSRELYKIFDIFDATNQAFQKAIYPNLEYRVRHLDNTKYQEIYDRIFHELFDEKALKGIKGSHIINMAYYEYI